MPVSKRRHTPQRPGDPTRGAHRLLPQEARVTFRIIALTTGTDYDLTGRTLTTLTHPTNVFAAAWAHSLTHPDLGYAEGLAWTDTLGWNAHAWCLDAAGRIHELADAARNATGYKGWAINRAAALKNLVDVPVLDRPILEVALAASPHDWTHVLDTLTVH